MRSEETKAPTEAGGLGAAESNEKRKRRRKKRRRKRTMKERRGNNGKEQIALRRHQSPHTELAKLEVEGLRRATSVTIEN